jgi:hypothetical protein
MLTRNNPTPTLPQLGEGAVGGGKEYSLFEGIRKEIYFPLYLPPPILLIAITHRSPTNPFNSTTVPPPSWGRLGGGLCPPITTGQPHPNPPQLGEGAVGRAKDVRVSKKFVRKFTSNFAHHSLYSALPQHIETQPIHSTIPQFLPQAGGG